MLTVKELARKLGLSERTIYAYRTRLGLPYYKFGRSIRFDEKEVEEWLAQRRKHYKEESDMNEVQTQSE